MSWPDSHETTFSLNDKNIRTLSSIMWSEEETNVEAYYYEKNTC